MLWMLIFHALKTRIPIEKCTNFFPFPVFICLNASLFFKCFYARIHWPFFFLFQWTNAKYVSDFYENFFLFVFVVVGKCLFFWYVVLIHNKIINIWCTRWWLCEEWLLIIILVDMLPLTAIVLLHYQKKNMHAYKSMKHFFFFECYTYNESM